jgi:hypothetical protein
VRLHVLAILNAAVFVVVDAKASNDGSRAEGLRDAEPVRKSVQPKNVEKNHLNQHLW